MLDMLSLSCSWELVLLFWCGDAVNFLFGLLSLAAFIHFATTNVLLGSMSETVFWIHQTLKIGSIRSAGSSLSDQTKLNSFLSNQKLLN